MESRSSWRVSGVLTARCAWSIPEMRPTSVAIPVAVTTNSPAPRVTAVFMYTMQARSPSGRPASPAGAVPFEAGRLSPVSPDSATSSIAACSSLPSAGTMSPAAIATTSPGTSCPAGISASWPSRRTRAVTIIIFCSAATAASALPSCCRPRTALPSVSRISRMPVPSCLMGKRLRAPAASKTTCMGSEYWRMNASQPGSALPAASMLGPNRPARDTASAELRPRCASAPTTRSTRSTLSVCHARPLACSTVSTSPIAGGWVIDGPVSPGRFAVCGLAGGTGPRSPRARRRRVLRRPAWPGARCGAAAVRRSGAPRVPGTAARSRPAAAPTSRIRRQVSGTASRTSTHRLRMRVTRVAAVRCCTSGRPCARARA